MNTRLIENKTYEKTDFRVNKMIHGEYENCTFLNCNLYDVDLSDIIFRECVFNGCDMSLVKIKNTVLNDIKFINCKLLGSRFDFCNSFLLTIYFENCVMKLSSFFKLKLKKTKFINCNLQEADFTEADLTSAVFENCDLHRAIFEATILEKADFCLSYNYSIDPEKNRIKKARFSRMGVVGLLDKYDIEIE